MSRTPDLALEPHEHSTESFAEQLLALAGLLESRAETLLDGSELHAGASSKENPRFRFFIEGVGVDAREQPATWARRLEEVASAFRAWKVGPALPANRAIIEEESALRYNGRDKGKHGAKWEITVVRGRRYL
jgi:hypothetical protein